MVMYKEQIPLVPAEEIGFHFGLVVAPARSFLFYKVRTSEVRPPAGYGTQIYDPKYEPNAAFRNLGLPLSLKIEPVAKFESSEDLMDALRQIEERNGNGLLCFNHGALVDEPNRDWGHVVVFDRIVEGQVRIIDPSPDHPKWRQVEVGKLLQAMKKHGVERSAGIWSITKTT
jgi:hypothetical protein